MLPLDVIQYILSFNNSVLKLSKQTLQYDMRILSMEPFFRVRDLYASIKIRRSKASKNMGTYLLHSWHEISCSSRWTIRNVNKSTLLNLERKENDTSIFIYPKI